MSRLGIAADLGSRRLDQPRGTKLFVDRGWFPCPRRLIEEGFRTPLPRRNIRVIGCRSHVPGRGLQRRPLSSSPARRSAGDRRSQPLPQLRGGISQRTTHPAGPYHRPGIRTLDQRSRKSVAPRTVLEHHPSARWRKFSPARFKVASSASLLPKRRPSHHIVRAASARPSDPFVKLHVGIPAEYGHPDAMFRSKDPQARLQGTGHARPRASAETNQVLDGLLDPQPGPPEGGCARRPPAPSITRPSPAPMTQQGPWPPRARPSLLQTPCVPAHLGAVGEHPSTSRPAPPALRAGRPRTPRSGPSPPRSPPPDPRPTPRPARCSITSLQPRCPTSAAASDRPREHAERHRRRAGGRCSTPMSLVHGVVLQADGDPSRRPFQTEGRFHRPRGAFSHRLGGAVRATWRSNNHAYESLQPAARLLSACVALPTPL